MHIWHRMESWSYPRVFFEGSDFFVARYTVMERTMDKAVKGKWFDKLKKVRLWK